MKYVFSTLTNDHRYTNWTRPIDPRMFPTIAGMVSVRGGANRATDPNSKGGRHTPLGVCTEVTDEQYEELLKNKVFQKHVASGFIIVRDNKGDPEVIAQGMKARDSSAPLTPESPQFKRPGDGAVKPEKKGKKAKASSDE